MTVPHRTPHVRAEWLYARDVAEDLGVSRPTAQKLLKGIPGAELLYRYENRAGERWRVSRDEYDRWRATQQNEAAGSA